MGNNQHSVEQRSNVGEPTLQNASGTPSVTRMRSSCEVMRMRNCDGAAVICLVHWCSIGERRGHHQVREEVVNLRLTSVLRNPCAFQNCNLYLLNLNN